MNKEAIEKKIGILDWGIVFSGIILLLIVYIPNHIWKEERLVRNESRHRMEIIADAEEFYKELTGEYTTDGKKLYTLVEAAMDSLIADSLFLGEQIIHINDYSVNVNLIKGFEIRVDTTFSFPINVKRTTLDTIYTVGMLNEETGNIDTTFINSKNITAVKNDTLFHSIFQIDTTSYTESYKDYLRKKYKLSFDLLNCPLTNEPYLLNVDSENPDETIFSVISPVSKDYTESRYLFFKFEAGYHGSIIDGQKSWAEN